MIVSHAETWLGYSFDSFQFGFGFFFTGTLCTSVFSCARSLYNLDEFCGTFFAFKASFSQ